MMKLSAIAAALAISAVVGSTAPAQTVLTFEDISANSCNNVRPNMALYQGVDFLSEWTCYGYAESPFTAHSGTNRIYASEGEINVSSASFTFGSTVFDGAWFAGATAVYFELFNGANLVATSSTLSTAETPAFLASGFAGNIDRVRVVGRDEQWVMDDLTFNSIVTPEPGTYAMLGVGLLAMGFVARRRRAS